MRWTDAPGPAAAALAAWLDVHGPRGAPPSRGEVAVLLEPAAHATAWAHVVASSLERGGLLLGSPLVEGSTLAAVYVRAAVPALDDRASAISLQMNAAVWDAARAALAPGECVVGWFHSHPGIGAFFSGIDRRTQAGFFNHPFSLGWVIDPQRQEEAWFRGAGSAALEPTAVVRLAPPASTHAASPR
jgi:proteasome lid subunit RPN8/RPN11